MTTLTVTIYREPGSFATSFDVWAKFRAYPQNDGDGVYVGEYEVDPDESAVTFDWDTPNGSDDWRLIALPIYLDQVGLPGRLEIA